MVFLAELLGDKAVYTISGLATQYRPLPVLCGIFVAFAGKMAAAVLIGQFIIKLPASFVAMTSAATFFVMCLVLWFEESKGGSQGHRGPLLERSNATVALISFAAIFFSEWGDVGQITTAALTASYKVPLTIWLAATLAMLTKGLLAMTLGVGLRKQIPQRLLRYGSACLFLVMAVVSALRTTNQ